MEVRLARSLLIAEILAADGTVTDGERRHLESVMEQLGLSEDERQRCRALDGLDEAEAIVATRLHLDARREFVDDLARAVLADGVANADEMAVVDRITTALGLKAVSDSEQAER